MTSFQPVSDATRLRIGPLQYQAMISAFYSWLRKIMRHIHSRVTEPGNLVRVPVNTQLWLYFPSFAGIRSVNGLVRLIIVCDQHGFGIPID